MLARLKTLVRRKKQEPSRQTPRLSRELKPGAEEDSIKKPTASYRDLPSPFPWMSNFEGFRHMFKDLSKRLNAIRGNPEETYLINTEVNLRLLGVLENIANATERNAAALEKLTEQARIKQHAEDDSDKKRRAREVLGILEKCGPLTYEELRRELKPEISYKRVTALVSEMIRDGVPLQRQGKPVKVSLGV